MNKPEEDVDVFIRDNFRPFYDIFPIDAQIFEKYKKKTLSIMDALRKG